MYYVLVIYIISNIDVLLYFQGNQSSNSRDHGKTENISNETPCCLLRKPVTNFREISLIILLRSFSIAVHGYIDS